MNANDSVQLNGQSLLDISRWIECLYCATPGVSLSGRWQYFLCVLPKFVVNPELTMCYDCVIRRSNCVSCKRIVDLSTKASQCDIPDKWALLLRDTSVHPFHTHVGALAIDSRNFRKLDNRELLTRTVQLDCSTEEVMGAEEIWINF